MARRSMAALARDALDALLDAGRSRGLRAHEVPSSEGDDSQVGFVVDVEGVVLLGVAKSLVTAGDATGLVRTIKRRKQPGIVVADRIAEDAKAAFRKAAINYLDRRGELRIVVPPVVVDTTVPASVQRGRSDAGPLTGQVDKEVAIACLLTPDRPHGVRDTAAYIERAPSAVSKTMAALRGAGLLTSRGEAIVPDLFESLAAVWRREPVALANLPRPGNARGSDQLTLGLKQPETTTGWALTDTRAASSWGIPMVAPGDYPPDFYVPTAAVLRRARALFGAATDTATRACTIALAPVRLVCMRRYDHAQRSGETWPVASHVVVALDVAADTARGREMLDQWRPDDVVRPW